MEIGHRLRAALEKASLVSYSGVVSRFVFERHRATSGSPVGSLLVPGRYNAPGIPALYTSFRRIVACAEFTRLVADDQIMDAASMLTLLVRVNRVLDLQNATTRKLLATSREELLAPRIPGKICPTQRLSEAAIAIGVDSIIAPSAVVPTETNLIIFPQQHTIVPYVIATHLTNQ
jgi:RES domain-containing protein